MKHAGPKALDALEPLLAELRKIEGLREKSRGCFYRRGRGFLHFHEDPAGFFADITVGDDFARFPVNTAIERKALLQKARAAG
jgi:hypothetical protein